MRLLSLTVSFLLFSSVCFSQITNNGFENWATDSSGNINPVGWETSNNPSYISVDSVTPGHSGSYAMRVKTVYIIMGGVPGAAILQTGFSFTQTPTRFGAWVRSTIMPGDTAYLIVGLTKGDTVVAATDSCTFKIDSSYAQFTYLEFPLRITTSTLPDSLYIMVATSLTSNPQFGTELIVDDMAFLNPVTTVSPEKNLPGSFRLLQNYPNPFNPETVIGFQLSAATAVKLTIHDLLGRTMATLVDETVSAGSHQAVWNASGFPSGMYFYRLQTGSGVNVKKMALMR